MPDADSRVPLPNNHHMETLIPVLYAISMAVLIIYGVNLLWLAMAFAWRDERLEGEVPDPDALPKPDSSWPSVTVQLPLFNEQFVAERIIDNVIGLDYPKQKLEIQVLDDSIDETVEIVEKRVEHW